MAKQFGDPVLAARSCGLHTLSGQACGDDGMFPVRDLWNDHWPEIIAVRNERASDEMTTGRNEARRGKARPLRLPARWLVQYPKRPGACKRPAYLSWIDCARGIQAEAEATAAG